MADMDNLGLVCRLASNMLQGTFFGGGLYCTLIECPSRAAMLSPRQMLENWNQTFPRAKKLQSRLLMGSVATGLTGWYLDSDPQSWLQLVSSCVMFLAGPWTLVGIMPTNYALMDMQGAIKKGDDFIVKTLTKWRNVHTVRVFTSGCALLLGGLYWANKAKPIF